MGARWHRGKNTINRRSRGHTRLMASAGAAAAPSADAAPDPAARHAELEATRERRRTVIILRLLLLPSFRVNTTAPFADAEEPFGVLYDLFVVFYQEYSF